MPTFVPMPMDEERAGLLAERRQKVALMHEYGLSISGMARRLDVTRRQVTHDLKSLGLGGQAHPGHGHIWPNSTFFQLHFLWKEDECSKQ